MTTSIKTLLLALALGVAALPVQAEEPRRPVFRAPCATVATMAPTMAPGTEAVELTPTLRRAVAWLWAYHDKATEWVKRHGYPTGAALWRFADGSHLVAYTHGPCIRGTLPLAPTKLRVAVSEAIGWRA